jgi:hypothetical protein
VTATAATRPRTLREAIEQRVAEWKAETTVRGALRRAFEKVERDEADDVDADDGEGFYLDSSPLDGPPGEPTPAAEAK